MCPTCTIVSYTIVFIYYKMKLIIFWENKSYKFSIVAEMIKPLYQDGKQKRLCLLIFQGKWFYFIMFSGRFTMRLSSF